MKELLKTLSNGQWVLEKINRNLYGSPEEYGVDPAREQEETISRAKSLNPDGVRSMKNQHGIEEPHILVHRGLHSYSASQSKNPNMLKITPSHVETFTNSVHTLDLGYADAYTTGYSEDGATELPGKGRVFSFWVPKSHVLAVGEEHEVKRDDSGKPNPENHFVSIKPGKYKRALYLRKSNENLLKWTNEEQDKAVNWSKTGDRRHLSNLPPISGGERHHMLRALEQKTPHRINPSTGKQEFLLHRAHVHPDPFSTPESYLGLDPKEYPETITPEDQRSPLTSWSTDKEFANYWLENNEGKGKITSAWIPHDQIHSYLTHGLKDHSSGGIDEEEVIVYPHP